MKKEESHVTPAKFKWTFKSNFDPFEFRFETLPDNPLESITFSFPGKDHPFIFLLGARGINHFWYDYPEKVINDRRLAIASMQPPKFETFVEVWQADR